MKSKYHIFFGIVLFVFTISCSHQAIAESESMGLSSFTDSEHGYSFSHPDEWKASLYRSGIVVSEVNSPNGFAGVQFRITNYNKSEETFTDNYIAKIEKDLNARIINKQSTVINKIECLEIEFSAIRSGTNYYLYQLIYFVSDVSKLVIIQAGCKTDNKEIAAPIIHKIATSLIFIDKNKL